MKKWIALAGCVAIALMNNGCAVGRQIDMRHRVGTDLSISTTRDVSVAVEDNREFVVSGNKKPSYIGNIRAGFGNVWDVHNVDHRALADQFRQDLEAELQAHGINIVSSGERQIEVDIKDWNFDAYQNGRVWYEIEVSVLDANGKFLAKTTAEDEHTVRGTFWEGGIGGLKRDVPRIYSDIIKEILEDNAIQNALK